MIKKYNVLIVDDHPQITDSYENALDHINSKNNAIEFDIAIAHDSDQALNKIKNMKFDLVFLDIKIPPSSDGKILSGEDLGIEIRKQYPDVKIIVCTMFNDNYRLHNILKSLNPEGFLVKNDLTRYELPIAINKVINDEPYHSKTVTILLRKHISNEFHVDKTDRQLLYELSIGTKMKDLPKILPLSIAGIEKRKRNLKVIFDVEGQDDKALIMVAKEKGFI